MRIIPTKLPLQRKRHSCCPPPFPSQSIPPFPNLPVTWKRRRPSEREGSGSPVLLFSRTYHSLLPLRNGSLICGQRIQGAPPREPAARDQGSPRGTTHSPVEHLYAERHALHTGSQIGTLLGRAMPTQNPGGGPRNPVRSLLELCPPSTAQPEDCALNSSPV